MKRHTPWVYVIPCLCVAVCSQQLSAQQPDSGSQQQLPSALSAQQAVNGPAAPGALTWDQVKTKFEAANPQLKADALNVDELRAEEITAFLRPNPQLTFSEDGAQIAPSNGV